MLWQKIYHSASQATDYLPYGLTARKFSSTPSVSGNLFSVNSVGPTSSQSAVWRDGAPVSGSVASGASQTGWTATPNAYGDITSQTVKPGGVAGNALTTNFDGLGIPSTITGTIAANCTSSFDANGVWSMSLERHGHSTLTSTSAKGDPLENRGYGLTDGTWDPPTYSGSSFTKKLTTPGVGNPTFTWNLAGTLKSRQFPDGTGESFTYNANGGLQSWTTPKGPSFDFNPNIFGQPQKIGDAGNLGYDAAGRVNEVTTKVASSVVDDYTQSYTNGQPDIQEHIAGILQGAKVDRDYDDYGHLKKVTLPGGVSMSYVYGGTNGTISTVTTAGGLGGTWTDPNVVTGQPQNLQLGPLTTTTAWDGLGRVTGQSSTSGGSTWSYGSYNYDEDGHCYQVTSTPDGAWAYGYDATKGWLTTATQGARTFNYGFDAAGRISGNGTTDFRPGTRHNNPVVEISGSVAPGATVTINGAAATLDANHQFDVFTPPLPTGWPIFTIRGTLPGQGYNGTDAIAEETRQVYVPPAAEPLSYTDGSRSGDARWSYGFDTLDRMTTATESAAVPGSTGPRVIYCTYDLNGRRIEKKVVQPGQPVRRTTTLWDGWRPVMEIERAAETIVARRYYTWGPDVSGSIDGAAGIGGLLEVLEVKGGTTTRSLPIYDGVGNVVGLVDGTSGLRVATYQYGPFGENLGVWGDRASSCPFRYQTRLYDDETGLSYFGQRYYDAKTQAWLSRDPLRESGGVNLYAYCGNDPVSGHDPIGLSIELNLDGSATFYGDGYSSYRGLQDYLQTPLGTVTFILQNARAEHDDLNRAVGYLGEGEAHRLLQLQGEIPRIERFVTYETNRIAAAGQFGNTLAAEKEAASNTPGWSWLGVEGEIADIRAIGIGIGAIKNPRFGDYFAASLNSPLAYSRAATLGVEIGLSLTGLPEDSLAVNSGGPPLRFSRVGGSSGFVYASEEMMQAALRDPAIYGVKFRVLPKFNPALDSSFMGLTTGTGLEATVEIGPSAFVSRQELLDTIIHEETHIRLDLRTFRGSQRASLFQSARSLEEEYVDSVAGRFFRRFGGRE